MGSLGWTQLSDFTFTIHFHALEKEMATHSSVLAWRIPLQCSCYGVSQSRTRLKRLSSSSSSRPSLFLQPYHIKPLPVTPAAAAPATSSHCSHEAPSCLWAFALFLPRILLLRLLSQLTMSYPPYWIMRSLGSESKHGPIYLPSTYQATGPW